MTDGGTPLPPRHAGTRRTGARVLAAAPVDREPSGPAPGRILPTRERRRGEDRHGVTSPFVIAPIIVLTLIYGVYLVAVAGDTAGVQPMPASAVFLIPLTVVLVYALIRRAAAEERRFDLRTIMLTGFVLRLGGTYLRWSDPADALEYQRVGVELAARFRQFDLWPETGRTIPGTGWLRYVTGVVQVFTFDDAIATYFVFAAIAFLGSYFCYRAFAIAVPEGRHRKYALFVFLWPSLCYWPSSIGKESWMIMAIGVSCYGVARFYTSKPGLGLGILALGLVLVSLLRPHVGLMLLVGFTTALLARGTERRSTSRMLFRIVAVVLVLVGGSIVAARAADVLKVDSTGTENISEALDNASVQTSQGTGRFDAVVVTSPVEYPWAFVTVWFRPLPWEARSGAAQLLSGLEDLLLFGLVLASWRQLKNLPRAILRLPYVTFSVSYCLAFVFGFSAIGNFGILARQRTQGLLLFFVMLCIPELSARGAGARFRDRTTDDVAEADGDGGSGLDGDGAPGAGPPERPIADQRAVFAGAGAEGDGSGDRYPVRHDAG